MGSDISTFVDRATSKLDWENDSWREAMLKMFVRLDAGNPEPRDFICTAYSLLSMVDESYRTEPPLFYSLFDLPATLQDLEEEQIGRIDELMIDKVNSLEQRFENDPSSCGPEFTTPVFAWHFAATTLMIDELKHVYDDMVVRSKEPVAEVLTKRSMCGEGWKHGRVYLKVREVSHAVDEVFNNL